MKRLLNIFRREEDPGEALANMLMLVFLISTGMGFALAVFVSNY